MQAMELNFEKYQATGNDFVMIDNRDDFFDKDNKGLISKLCNRRFGIGSDGLILIEEDDKYDFRMEFFNPDSSKSLCGNGSRCAVRFAKSIGMVKNETEFSAFDGVHEATVKGELVSLKMRDVSSVILMHDGFFMNTGSPHFVQFVAKINQYNVQREGKKIRHGGLFGTSGTNVNFVEEKGDDTIFVRTYERGVENETLSCGTGVTAAALASSYKMLKSPVKIKTRGGNLQVAFQQSGNNSFKDILLTGPAEKVFEGSISIKS